MTHQSSSTKRQAQESLPTFSISLLRFSFCFVYRFSEAMAPTLQLTSTDLVLSLTTCQKLLAVQFSPVSVPLKHITNVRVRPDDLCVCWNGLRVGTSVPGVFYAGNFYHLHRKPDFIYARKKATAIALDLADGSQWAKIIFEVEDGRTPEEVAQDILKAIENARS
ncbi:uncharacterized protein SPPG_02479 [Spizellomyces punctatus DAOM BR117]|uniref:Uncharacterized protein n=1 Tax=Spizellomyces punctatus (strain DAOM BR117) TaxID=645134 RepID=A0A0L0HLH8_SPIPD|nr:uncharacterized protein SPPG_02479 [Spizellomyces punctatus DAOM BR117]KND01972.1 hypothetical protein SPPG_02479 [Spizellomyces punctatus DAOM BR117]|eukprot:XP_016610011.1 hypothetical protein SPPG_02479 [Spizellomyces punctatus DAOM BR117]